MGKVVHFWGKCEGEGTLRQTNKQAPKLRVLQAIVPPMRRVDNAINANEGDEENEE